jgi:hypothetical protein
VTDHEARPELVQLVQCERCSRLSFQVETWPLERALHSSGRPDNQTSYWAALVCTNCGERTRVFISHDNGGRP